MPEPWTQKCDVAAGHGQAAGRAGWVVEAVRQRAWQPHTGPALGLRLGGAVSVGFSTCFFSPGRMF